VIKIKKKEVGGACSMDGKLRNAYRILVRKPEGKIPHRFKWEKNIEIYHKEIHCVDINWIH
jgi:hypothetical protein